MNSITELGEYWVVRSQLLQVSDHQIVLNVADLRVILIIILAVMKSD